VFFLNEEYNMTGELNYQTKGINMISPLKEVKQANLRMIES
jgi:ribosomal protein S8